jgi:hypothetical protein
MQVGGFSLAIPAILAVLAILAISSDDGDFGDSFTSSVVQLICCLEYPRVPGSTAPSAEGATHPSPDREVGVPEGYDGEPRRGRHKGAK